MTLPTRSLRQDAVNVFDDYLTGKRRAAVMKKGLYRISLKGLGECARVHFSAGDAAPFLDRSSYEILDFEPAFDALPTKHQYRHSNGTLHIPKDRCEEIWAENP